MQITKEKIIEVLNGYAYQQKSCELDRFIIDADFSSVADEILTLLQSNDASQPNGSKPDVSGSLPPLDDETAATPIQNALYATGKFSTDDCSNLADGILQYIKDAKMSIVGGNDR